MSLTSANLKFPSIYFLRDIVKKYILIFSTLNFTLIKILFISLTCSIFVACSRSYSVKLQRQQSETYVDNLNIAIAT